MDNQEKTRKICKTCKHNPPSKKWPCVDCDMREPADRWEPQDIPDTNDGDTISRQAAIEAVHKNYDPILDFKSDGWTVACSFEDIINDLPSAEPEIVRCKDCKHRRREDKHIADGRYWCELHNAFMYYCSRWERRTDE